MSSTNPALSGEFQAFVVDRDDAGRISSSIKTLKPDDLPGDAVFIRPRWSSLNYKDALAATGHSGVVRRFPHVPGIDLAGEVVGFAADQPPAGLSVGDEVIVTGFDLGAGHWGGWSELVCVPASWIVPRPPALSLRQAMVLGTAGFTAAMCVQALQHHGIHPSAGDVVVTGASGGVGALAIHLLAKLGYHVVGVSGKPDQRDRIKSWGARDVLDRSQVIDTSGKPLLPGIWAGVVDTAGGAMLGTLIRQTRPHGCVAACGLVAGTDLPITVYPFILRGVTLAGIDSGGYPLPQRIALWGKLADEWQLDELEPLVTETTLAEVGSFVPRILAGEIVGRTVVRMK